MGLSVPKQREQSLLVRLIPGEIKDHRMEATFKPAAERLQVALLRPSGGDTIPTIELFLEDFADATP
jgi:hypothetical protein